MVLFFTISVCWFVLHFGLILKNTVDYNHLVCVQHYYVFLIPTVRIRRLYYYFLMNLNQIFTTNTICNNSKTHLKIIQLPKQNTTHQIKQIKFQNRNIHNIHGLALDSKQRRSITQITRQIFEPLSHHAPWRIELCLK